MTSWRLHVLGSSSTRTPPGDSTASLALSNGRRTILIDAGGNLPARLERADLDPSRVTDIVITHSHPDHTYGFPFFSHSFYHDHREVTCWSTPEAIPRLEASLDAYDLQEPDQYLSVSFREIPLESPQSLELTGDLTTRSIPTDHSRPSFGLKLESDNETVVFTGDTSPCAPVREASGDAGVLIHDCQGLHGYRRYFAESHTSALELGELADEVGVPTLVPFHHNLVEVPGGWEEIGAELREHFDGQILYPRQGMGFVL